VINKISHLLYYVLAIISALPRHNFVANGGELTEENVFKIWAAFEPSKSAIFGERKNALHVYCS